MEAEYQCASHVAQTFEGYVSLFVQLGSIVESPSRIIIGNAATIGAICTLFLPVTIYKAHFSFTKHGYKRL